MIYLRPEYRGKYKYNDDFQAHKTYMLVLQKATESTIVQALHGRASAGLTECTVERRYLQL